MPARELSGRAGAAATVYNLDKLSFTAEFVQQGWDDLAGLFSLSNSVLNVDAVYFLTEEIYLNAYFDQAWFQLATGDFDSANDVGVNLGFAQE